MEVEGRVGGRKRKRGRGGEEWGGGTGQAGWPTRRTILLRGQGLVLVELTPAAGDGVAALVFGVLPVHVRARKLRQLLRACGSGVGAGQGRPGEAGGGFPPNQFGAPRRRTVRRLASGCTARRGTRPPARRAEASRDAHTCTRHTGEAAARLPRAPTHPSTLQQHAPFTKKKAFLNATALKTNTKKEMRGTHICRRPWCHPTPRCLWGVWQECRGINWARGSLNGSW